VTGPLIPWPDDNPTVRLWPTAAKAFNLGRSTAYAMAANGTFPVKALRVGGRWFVRTAELRRALGLPTARNGTG